jgi:hypothetical protein
VPDLPIVTPPTPNLLCGLFDLSSQAGNESYDFFKLLISDLTSNWKLP